MGVSLLPNFFVEDEIKEGRLTNLFADELDERVGVYTLLPVRRQVTPTARAFADFVVGCFADGVR